MEIRRLTWLGSVSHRIAAAGFCVAGSLAAALAWSVHRHAELVAYGIKGFSARVLAIELGFGGLALGLLLLARLAWRAKGRVVLIGVTGVTASLLVGGFAAFGLYSLEVTYEKGDSDLGNLARHCRDLPSWQARSRLLRHGILQAANLDPLPARTPLNAVVHSRRERNGYSVENVRLETIPGFYLAGNLYRPASADLNERLPVVLVPHGHFRDGRCHPDNQELAATLARMGAIVFLYDMVGRGENTQVTHKNPNALTLQLWNSMRVLDFLLALPEADPARVAMTGASGGGTQTLLCTAVDERVKVPVPVVMVSSWVYGGCPCESGLPIHRGADYATDNAEIAALAAPRPQLIVSDGLDWTRTVPVREFPYIQGVYRLYGAGSLVRNVHLAREAHDFGPSKREAVYVFLAEQLHLSLNRVAGREGQTDETPNTVETPETMRATDQTHPLPADALKGWEAVRAKLLSLPPAAGN